VNSLVVLPSEMMDQTRALLEGARAAYAFDTHGVREGQLVKVSVLGGLRGEAKILEATSTRVFLETHLSLPCRERAPISLVVGVCRPQTIKKVVQAAVMFGVSSLHFVRSELGDKSYLQSRSLDPAELEEETIKALEQVWDSCAPEIVVHRTFSYFMEHKVSGIADLLARESAEKYLARFVAHPGGRALGCADAPRLKDAPAIVAIGPERGWSDGEIESFRNAGFEVLGLGERVVRVELALVFLLGRLTMLRA
jgi:16S rRNA (uracil1498-N3)-methyltransferase